MSGPRECRPTLSSRRHHSSAFLPWNGSLSPSRPVTPAMHLGHRPCTLVMHLGRVHCSRSRTASEGSNHGAWKSLLIVVALPRSSTLIVVAVAAVLVQGSATASTSRGGREAVLDSASHLRSQPPARKRRSDPSTRSQGCCVMCSMFGSSLENSHSATAPQHARMPQHELQNNPGAPARPAVFVASGRGAHL